MRNFPFFTLLNILFLQEERPRLEKQNTFYKDCFQSKIGQHLVLSAYHILESITLAWCFSGGLGICLHRPFKGETSVPSFLFKRADVISELLQLDSEIHAVYVQNHCSVHARGPADH